MNSFSNEKWYPFATYSVQPKCIWHDVKPVQSLSELHISLLKKFFSASAQRHNIPNNNITITRLILDDWFDQLHHRNWNAEYALNIFRDDGLVKVISSLYVTRVFHVKNENEKKKVFGNEFNFIYEYETGLLSRSQLSIIAKYCDV